VTPTPPDSRPIKPPSLPPGPLKPGGGNDDFDKFVRVAACLKNAINEFKNCTDVICASKPPRLKVCCDKVCADDYAKADEKCVKDYVGFPRDQKF
jgi:hypothetical protein